MPVFSIRPSRAPFAFTFSSPGVLYSPIAMNRDFVCWTGAVTRGPVKKNRDCLEIGV